MEFFSLRNKSTQKYAQAYRNRLKRTLKEIQTPGKGETSLLHSAMMLEFGKPDIAKLRQKSARPGVYKSREAQNLINEMYAFKVYRLLNKTA